jgi:SdrD B-like domain
VIFTGTVKSKFTVNTPGTVLDAFTQNVFQFSVSESFRGSAIAGQEITIYTGVGGGDCGYDFKVGTSYLVYASLYNGKLITSICTPTSPAAQMRAIIRQLRALQRGERVADLFGIVGTSPLTFADDPRDVKPLAGKRVRVLGSRNSEQSTTTDDEGVYSFQDLPADTYRIEVDPPAGMSTWQLNKGETYKVEVGAQGVSGCPASVSFSADGRIKGRVVDEDGNGVAGFVILEPADEKEAEVARWRGGIMGYTTDNGEFELWLLHPSRYRLIFRPKIGDQVNFRVTPAKSEVITVGMGQHIENFRFSVPSRWPN